MENEGIGLNESLSQIKRVQKALMSLNVDQMNPATMKKMIDRTVLAIDGLLPEFEMMLKTLKIAAMCLQLQDGQLARKTEMIKELIAETSPNSIAEHDPEAIEFMGSIQGVLSPFNREMLDWNAEFEEWVIQCRHNLSHVEQDEAYLPFDIDTGHVMGGECPKCNLDFWGSIVLYPDAETGRVGLAKKCRRCGCYGTIGDVQDWPLWRNE